MPQRWHQFLIYIGFTVASFVINAFMNSWLPLLYRGAFAWSIGGFVLVSITVLACASPNYNTAYFVFREFINTTGCKHYHRQFTHLHSPLQIICLDANSRCRA
jgi:choline transport protein